MTPPPPIEEDSALVLPAVAAIVNDATGGAPQPDAFRNAPHNNIEFHMNIVPAEDNEIEPPADAPLPLDDQYASDSSMHPRA